MYYVYGFVIKAMMICSSQMGVLDFGPALAYLACLSYFIVVPLSLLTLHNHAIVCLTKPVWLSDVVELEKGTQAPTLFTAQTEAHGAKKKHIQGRVPFNIRG